MAQSANNANVEESTGILLPDGLVIVARYVAKDAKLDEYDRILADCQLNGKKVFQVGLHAPIGTLKKGGAYNLGEEAHISRVQGNRVEIYLGDEDPAIGVDYTVEVEVQPLPF